MNGLLDKEVVNYVDVTEEWLNKDISNSHRVLDAKYYQDNDGEKYYVDAYNVVLDYSKHELEAAYWLVNNFGGTIYMLPRINNPDGISTPDYLWNGEKWDLKEIRASGNRCIDNRINGSKRQTSNYVLDITGNLLTDDEISEQLKKIYMSKERSWVDKIIVIRNSNIVLIYKRK